VTAPRFLLPDAVFDGLDLHPRVAVALDGERVAALVPAADLPADGVGVERLAGATLSPGFVDTHVHLTLGTKQRSYEAVMREDSDGRMLLRSVKNALEHLAVGVTTMRDCGGRGRTTLELAEAARAGAFDVFPEVQVSGRPITITGGHFHWCGEEADGVEGVRTSVRRMIKDGADFIKVMASGGGTAGTWLGHASFTVEELSAIVAESRRHGKLTTVHCLATTSIANAVAAGFDSIEHCGFQRPDGVVEFVPEVGRRLVDAGIWYSPTIQTGYRRLERTRARHAAEPDEATAASLAAVTAKVEGQLEVVARMHELGARIVMGTDAIAEFGDYAIGLELQVRAGMTPLQALRSGTSLAAESIGLGDRAGRIAPGRVADLVALDGDPTSDVAATGRVLRVWRRGKPASTAPDLFRA
jgi:imidazolonepropionase-like amidohydrolase